MKTKKIPMRMCTGCGEMFDKRELVRVVKSPEGEVSLDLTGKKAGRGAYVCKNADCLKKARKKRAFERAFSMQLDDEVYNKMEEEIENAHSKGYFNARACKACRQAFNGARYGAACTVWAQSKVIAFLQ